MASKYREKFGDIIHENFMTKIRDSYIDISLFEAANTFIPDARLKYFANEKVKQIDSNGSNLLDKDVEKFRVIIGSSQNLRQQYKYNYVNNHDTKDDKGNINIMDKLIEFIPGQFDFKHLEQPSVEKACNEPNNINIIIIGRQLNSRKKKPPLHYYKEIVAAVIIIKPTILNSYVLWLAVDKKEYNEAIWGNKTKSKNEDTLDFPLFSCSGFGRFLMASAQHYQKSFYGNSNLVLQAADNAADGYYIHHLHFSEIIDKKIKSIHKTGLGEYFIKNMMLLESNCDIEFINVSVYDNRKDSKHPEDAVKVIKNLYFNPLHDIYLKNEKQNENTTRTKLLKQHMPFETDIRQSSCSYRHSVLDSDNLLESYDDNTSIKIANTLTVASLVNDKNEDKGKCFVVEEIPAKEIIKGNFLQTISMRLYGTIKYANYLKFAITFIYEVLQRLNEEQPIFSNTINKEFFTNGLELLKRYRTLANIESDDLKSVNELTPLLKKELLKFIARDYLYNLRDHERSIINMDLSILSLIFNVKFVIYIAETYQNKSIFFGQRAWREKLESIPRVLTTFDVKNSIKSEDNQYVAIISLHNKNKYSYINIIQRKNVLEDAVYYVKAVAENINGSDPQLLVDKALEWNNDREGKNPTSNVGWEYTDIIGRVDGLNLQPFYRIFDPMLRKYRKNIDEAAMAMVDADEVLDIIKIDSFQTLRPGKWISNHVIDGFVRSLANFDSVKSGKIVILSPVDVSAISFVKNNKSYDVDERKKYATHYYQSFIERINKKECEWIYFIVNNNNYHYYCIELNLKKSLSIETFQLHIADSLDLDPQPKLFRDYYDLVVPSNVLVMLKELRPHFGYNFERANNLSLQNDCFECGVHCCRRVYSMVEYDQIIPPDKIDMKLESTANFRLLMANLIISNATFISRYLSPTGSYPEIINNEQIPMTMIPKIHRYNVIRITQFPSEIDISVTENIEPTSELNTDFEIESVSSNLVDFNNIETLNKSCTSSVWSSSVNSGNRLHSNNYGLNPKDNIIKQPIDIQETPEKPKLQSTEMSINKSDLSQKQDKLPNDINITKDENSEVSSIPTINATTNAMDVDASKVNKKRRKNQNNNKKTKSKKNKATNEIVSPLEAKPRPEVASLKSVPTPEQKERSINRRKLDFIYKESVAKSTILFHEDNDSNNLPRKESRMSVLRKTPKRKQDMSLKEIDDMIKEWDEPIPTSYQDYLDKGLVNCVTDDIDTQLLNNRMVEVKELRPKMDNAMLKKSWNQFLYNAEQLSESSLDKIVIKTIDEEISTIQKQINAKTRLMGTEINKKNKKNDTKITRYKMAIKDLRSSITIKEWEKKKIRIFHKTDSIYALKIKGDIDLEKKWKYYAVYKGVDGLYYESQVTLSFLQENFDPLFLKTWKNQVILDDFLIIRSNTMNFINKFPTDEFFQKTKDKFCDKIWDYRNKDLDLTVTNLRAVVTFDYNQTKLDTFFDKNKPKQLDDDKTEASDRTANLANITNVEDLIDNIKYNWSILFRKIEDDGTSKNTKHSDKLRIHKYYTINENDMLDVFGSNRYNEIRREIIKWWYEDIQQARHECSQMNHSFCICPEDRYIDNADKAKYFEFSDNICTKSPLGHKDQAQVYYWVYKPKYYWNETRAQISMIKWDIKKDSFIGKEWDPEKGRKKTVILPEKWVIKNFEELIPKLKEFAELTKSQFFQVPLANGRKTKVDSNDSENPIILYHQTDNKSCCFYSLCCALDYLLYKDEAKSLKDYRDYFFANLYLDNFYKIDTCIITHIINSMCFKKVQANFMIDEIKTQYNLFSNKVSEKDIRLVVLAGNDGSESHAVCIVDKFIFDSNCKFALDFNKKGLNDCCNGHKFLHVVRGYHFKYIQY